MATSPGPLRDRIVGRISQEDIYAPLVNVSPVTNKHGDLVVINRNGKLLIQGAGSTRCFAGLSWAAPP